MSSREKLEKEIIKLSNSSEYNIARLEWRVKTVFLSNDWSNCICGQDIKEVCELVNKHNNNSTQVGNICVNNFMQIDTGNLFPGLKRIIKDPKNAKPNIDVIEYASSKGFLHKETEIKFLLDIKNKRILSEKQSSWLSKINKRIINETVVRSSKKL